MFLIFYPSTLYKFNEKSDLKYLNYKFKKASNFWLAKISKKIYGPRVGSDLMNFKEKPELIVIHP